MSITPTPLPTPTYGPPGLGSFTVSSSTRINASPGTCLQIILDVNKYPEWNRFVPSVTIDSPSSTAQSHFGPDTLQLGTKFTFHVNMEAGIPSTPATSRPTALVVTGLSEVDEMGEQTEVDRIFDQLVAGGGGVGMRHRLAWGPRGSWSMPSWMLRSERVQEFRLVEREGDDRDKGLSACDYVNWETFYGVLAPVVRMAVGAKLEACFGVWERDLRRRAEGVDGDRPC